MVRGISTNQIIKGLIFGLVIMFLMTQIFNFAALGSDDPDASVFREDVNYDDLVPQTFKWLITGMAVWLAWAFIQIQTGAAGRLDRKRLVSMIITGVLLYFLYTKLIAPGLGLPDLSFTAYQLQSVSPAPIQSLLGSP
jgi:hypothetical protein